MCIGIRIGTAYTAHIHGSNKCMLWSFTRYVHCATTALIGS